MADLGIDGSFWRGRRVLLTGHTGFKGAWLSLWLQLLGARVTGFSRSVPTEPSLFRIARVGEGMDTIEGELRDPAAVAGALRDSEAEIVIHMGAQSLVRRSYEQPRETYEANVMGTVNVLDAVRERPAGVRAVLVVTSDKCYENRGAERAFREGDALGGDDPYSSSKGAAELVAHAYRRSYWPGAEGVRLATARAGNVFGGGDWAPDRLLPDLMRAAMEGEPVRVRNPEAVRPWQHVLGPLCGYLLLLQALCDGTAEPDAWNFGPPEPDARTVGWLVEHVAELWPGLRWTRDEGAHPAEAQYLRLDSSRARERLGWSGGLDLADGLRATVEWYRGLQDGAEMRGLTISQIEALQPALIRR